MSQNGNTPEIKFDVEERRELDPSRERSFCVDGRAGRIFASLDEDLQPNTTVEFYDGAGDVEDTVEVNRVFHSDDKMAQSCIALALEQLETEDIEAGER